MTDSVCVHITRKQVAHRSVSYRGLFTVSFLKAQKGRAGMKETASVLDCSDKACGPGIKTFLNLQIFYTSPSLQWLFSQNFILNRLSPTCETILLNYGFSTTTNILVQIILCGRESVLHIVRRLEVSLASVAPPSASRLSKPKMAPSTAKCSLEGKVTPS